MRKFLIKIGQKNILIGPKNSILNNLFINNGKHIVYSENNVYKGCGINSWNQICGENKCCTLNGQCVQSNYYVCLTRQGCQKNYSSCIEIKSSHKLLLL